MHVIELLSVATGVILALGAIERWIHQRHLKKIPVRIHVSGTRGKSSVTRLVAAGLRAYGVKTAAKTTGTLARMILPDGREVAVSRPLGANIKEQARIIATAEKIGAQVLVMECMALQPEFHWISERIFVRATHALITNIRADHLDEMGPTVEDVAKAIAGMIPVGGVLISGEHQYGHILKAAAEDRHTRYVEITDEDLAVVTDEDLDKFSYFEHRQNVALALRLLSELNIPKDVALQGMWKAVPDPGALIEISVDFYGRHITFINAFAANDPISTEQIWRAAQKRHYRT